MTLVVGIAGAMRSGKSTLATMLATTYDLPIVSFAESLRVEVSQAFFKGKSREDARFLWSMLEEVDKTKTRPILQAWGQAKRDLRDIDYWVTRMFEYMERKGIKVAICDDVRHTNEAETILNNGGIIIRLHANPDDLVSRGADLLAMGHSSENLIPLDNAMKGRQRVFHIETAGKSEYGVFVSANKIVRYVVDTGREEE